MLSSAAWAAPVKFLSRGKHVVTLKLFEAIEAWLALSPMAREMVTVELERAVKMPFGMARTLDPPALAHLAKHLDALRGR